MKELERYMITEETHNNNICVSVIIPVYNVEKYLERCLQSVLNQTYENIEIILVDDGSKDSSGLICDRYCEKYHHVKVIHKVNEGLGLARNTGLSAVTGKYVTFLDSDDYIGKSRISMMVEAMEKNQSDTCMTGYTKVYKDREEVHKHVDSGKVYCDMDVNKILLPKMCGADTSGKDNVEMSVCMVMFSNKLIKKYNIDFESERKLISEDLVFDFDYYQHADSVCILDNVDYYYCDNENSLTTKYRNDRFESQLVLYNVLMDKARELEIYQECKKRLDNTLVAIARYSIKLEEKFHKKNSLRTSYKNIKNICNNKQLIEIMSHMDMKGLRKGSLIINYMIKKKNVVLLLMIMHFKNKFEI